MDTLDILSAWSKHLEWKTKLMSFMEGGCGKLAIPEAQAISHRECGLGKWLYSRGLTKYAAFAAVRELEKKHEELHSAVRRMFQLQQARDEAGLKRECSKAQRLSSELIASLEELEKQVAAQPS
jgi:methyl-accepting chemotaxis protein